MKVLIVRFSSIGDIILTTPVLRCLKQKFGDNIEIHYLTKTPFVSLIETNPHVFKMHLIKKSFREISESLKQEDFDLVIDLHNNLRTWRLKSYLKVKSVSFPKLNISKWLYVKFKINNMPKIHVVDRYFETVKSLGVVNDLVGCEIVLLDSDRIIDNFDSTKLKDGYCTVAMGAQFETKQIPLSILTRVLEKVETPIVLLGSGADIERAELLRNSLEGRKVISLCGKTTLRQSGHVLDKSNFLLTGDTGLMHLASCFSTRIVSVWGNTTPDLGMSVYRPKEESNFSNHEVLGLKCRPCSKIGFHSCPKGHFKCMVNQDIESIVKDVLKN